MHAEIEEAAAAHRRAALTLAHLLGAFRYVSDKCSAEQRNVEPVALQRPVLARHDK